MRACRIVSSCIVCVRAKQKQRARVEQARIVREALVPISFVLVAPPGTALDTFTYTLNPT